MVYILIVDIMVLSHSVRHVLLLITLLLSVLVIVHAWRLLAVSLGHSGDIWSSVSFTDAFSPGWFILHPLLGILGTLVFPVPAVLLRKYKGYWSKKVHAYVFGLSLLLTSVCVYVIYAQREARGKAHFSSWHAIGGAGLGIGYVILSAVGLVALDPDYAFVKRMKSTLKWIHKSGGRILLVFGYGVCFSGWYKFFSQGPNMWAGILVGATASLLTYIDPLASKLGQTDDFKSSKLD